MRAIAAHQHITELQDRITKIWDDDQKKFVNFKSSVATPTYDEHGRPKLLRLDAHIEVEHNLGDRLYRTFYGKAADHAFTSLHRAKNAIRRHFRIESRRLLVWTEEQR